jgi:hypothetical protein
MTGAARYGEAVGDFGSDAFAAREIKMHRFHATNAIAG